MSRPPNRDGRTRPDRHDRFEKIVEQYETPLLRYAGRVLNNRNLAQDVVQCAFVKLFQAWRGEFEPSPSMSSWLYRVTHNCAVDVVRKSSRRQQLHERHAEEKSAREQGVEQADGQVEDIRELITQVMDVLNLRERQLVVLKVYEEKSYKEIAEIADLSVGNVGYILHHAMKKLAQRIRKEKDETKGGSEANVRRGGMNPER